MPKEAKRALEKKGETVPILFTTDQILRYLAQRRTALPLAEVCSSLGIARSTASRILMTLHQLGYLTKDPKKPIYALRHATLLASSIQQQQRELLVRVARPQMEQLAQKLGETIKLNILDASNYSVLVLCSAVGNNQMHIQVPNGASFPLHAGAASKLLLALDSTAWNEFRQKQTLPLEALTANTITDIDLLQDTLKTIAIEGWAYDEQEYQEGIEALACPVLSAQGLLLGALSIPYIANTTIRERIYKEKKAIQNCAVQIGRNYDAAVT